MKKLLYILLFICTASFGQYRATIQADDIPTSPENPVDPEWEDSVDFDILFWEDLQDFPITNVASATSPVGIDNDTMAEYWTNFSVLYSDALNNPDTVDNGDIIMLNGRKVIRAWYPEDQCCTGSDVGVAPVDGGTGFEIVAELTSPVSYTRRVIDYCLIRMPRSTDPMGVFVNSEGTKLPGLTISNTDSEGIARSLIVDWTTTTDISYYMYAYWNNWTAVSTVNSTKTISPDTWLTPGWHLLSKYYDAGTSEGDDGALHMYVDGKLIDDGSGGGIISSIPFLNSTSPAGWRQTRFATFMGGNTVDFTSTKDQAIDYGGYLVVTMDGYDTTPAAGQDLYVPKLIKDIWTDLLEADE